MSTPLEAVADLDAGTARGQVVGGNANAADHIHGFVRGLRVERRNGSSDACRSFRGYDMAPAPAPELPAGCMLIEREGLPPGCSLLKWADGEVDIVDAGLRVKASVRFDVDVEAWALFVHDAPRPPSAGKRPRGRRVSASSDPERLLAAFGSDAELDAVA
jgi:hypothetical protein